MTKHSSRYYFHLKLLVYVLLGSCSNDNFQGDTEIDVDVNESVCSICLDSVFVTQFLTGCRFPDFFFFFDKKIIFILFSKICQLHSSNQIEGKVCFSFQKSFVLNFLVCAVSRKFLSSDCMSSLSYLSHMEIF